MDVRTGRDAVFDPGSRPRLRPFTSEGLRRKSAVPRAELRRALSAGGLGGFAVGFGVRLSGFGSVMGGVMMMAAGDVGVMRREVMISFFVMTRGFAMMTRRVFVVLGSFVVMLDCVCGHMSSSRE